jgi:hypothetical protein
MSRISSSDPIRRSAASYVYVVVHRIPPITDSDIDSVLRMRPSVWPSTMNCASSSCVSDPISSASGETVRHEYVCVCGSHSPSPVAGPSVHSIA